jgi:DNA topoisomerase IA
MRLVIAEKPSVAKDIAAVLHATQKDRHWYAGDGAIVTWGFGHLDRAQRRRPRAPQPHARHPEDR